MLTFDPDSKDKQKRPTNKPIEVYQQLKNKLI